MAKPPADAPEPASRALCRRLIGAGAGLPDGPLSLAAMAAALRKARPNTVSTQSAQSLEELGQALEDGRGVIALVDAGALWNLPSAAPADAGFNHAVLVLAVSRDALTGEITGALVDDPAQPGAPVELDAAALVECWLAGGGQMLAVLDDDPPNFSTASP